MNAKSHVDLVRVVGPDFVAGFESDGTVRRAAPILKALVGMTDDEARAYIKAKGWTASIVPDRPSIEHHYHNFGGFNAGSFEVRHSRGRKYFYYDDNAGRRAVTGKDSKETEFGKAQAYLQQIQGTGNEPT
ncbi:hypothetical protein [Bradyrhizobium sp. CB2312]|uniref:hypothetical protein n=1 Tax=Bradyrhizobium sp. CB2312 TaxID=3039155 RepID=UPI0024B257CC|nr:hypothetical protein [Bradyrhizobium sp. CB2312]WFU75225.1 hypothetical protein QA642_14970 [Bradyrhizobium sp. CB2312]